VARDRGCDRVAVAAGTRESTIIRGRSDERPEMQRDSDPTLSPLQEALLGYKQSDLEKALIDWAREHWPMAARGMIYAKKEADDTVSGVQGIRDDQAKLALQVAVRAAIAERELVIRAIAAVLPEWIEARYGLTPRGE
jgi:hypothetical protein